MHIDEFRVGDRVELHPATDRWMRGDRFGVIESKPARYRAGARVIVKLDKSGQSVRFRPEDLLSIL